MPETDQRADDYIKKAAPFAQPILAKLRQLVFKACPDAKEVIKWGFPNYEVYGSAICNMAAFKEHCAFGFWKASLLKDPAAILKVGDKHSMGHLDRITSVKDLPADKIMIDYLKEAALLNKNNVKIIKPKSAPKKDLPVPQALETAFKKNKKAQTNFEKFSPSQRREYIEWLNEAKTEETMNRRLATIVEWVSEGKFRNWKYEK